MKRTQQDQSAPEKRCKLNSAEDQDPRDFINPSLFGSITLHPAFDPSKLPTWITEPVPEPQLVVTTTFRALQGVIVTAHPSAVHFVHEMHTNSFKAVDLAIAAYKLQGHPDQMPNVTEEHLSAFITIVASYACLIKHYNRQVRMGIKQIERPTSRPNLRIFRLKDPADQHIPIALAASEMPYVRAMHQKVHCVWAKTAIWPQICVALHLELPADLVHFIVTRLCLCQIDHQHSLSAKACRSNLTEASTNLEEYRRLTQ